MRDTITNVSRETFIHSMIFLKFSEIFLGNLLKGGVGQALGAAREGPAGGPSHRVSQFIQTMGIKT